MPAIMTPDAMRKRFSEAREESAHIEALVAPLRAAYDAKRNELMARERDELRPLIGRIREAEAPLYDLKKEMGALVRALNGRTG